MSKMNFFQKAYHRYKQRLCKNFEGIILDDILGEISDIQNYLESIRKISTPQTKIMIIYHNDFFQPLFDLASYVGLRRKTGTLNWVDHGDLVNLLNISGFEEIGTQKRFFGLSFVTTARPKYINPDGRKFSVSIIIPAKNEAGNIPKIIPSIPKFGKRQEIIFIEGGSKDQTRNEIEKEGKRKHKKNTTVKLLIQKGKGKANAVFLGLSKAKGDILIIYDADRTVDAKDLPKFYNALVSNLGEFANGNRLLYPMKGDAMQTINKLGNQIFSKLFTKILGQHFKDTLCGTKAFWKHDFRKFKRSKTDPFGDFDLIFGAIRSNLKIIEIPVRYKERVYGKTNINRFHHGFLLAKMVIFAFREFKID